MSDIVAIAFTPAPASQNPNLRKTTDASALSAYYRAMFVAFASVRRWNPDVELILITTELAPTPFKEELLALDVRTLETPFVHRPPDGYWPTFNASLYTIDAMKALADQATPGSRMLLIDPDVLCMGDLGPAFAAVRSGRTLVYATGISPEENSQGLDGDEAARLHEELDPGLSGPAVHYGGELYGFTSTDILPVLRRADDAWNFSIARWASGQNYFVTEEHLLNYALRRASLADGSKYIRRIWTAPVLRTVQGDEDTLIMWHLPSEKDRAFVQFARAASDRGSWFWGSEPVDYINKAGSLTGIPHRGPRRWLYDTSGRAARTAIRKLYDVTQLLAFRRR